MLPYNTNQQKLYTLFSQKLLNQFPKKIGDAQYMSIYSIIYIFSKTEIYSIQLFLQYCIHKFFHTYMYTYKYNKNQNGGGFGVQRL